MRPTLLMPTLLMIVPEKWSALAAAGLEGMNLKLHGRDSYAPEEIDYALGFRPPPGLLATLPRLKAIFSLGAGVDGFLSDPDFPKAVPLVRFVDRTLTVEMAQYVLMQVLIHHRLQRFFDDRQAEGVWQQRVLERVTEQTRVGFLGLGEIGAFTAERFVELNFQVSSWTRRRKQLAGVTSYAGHEELDAFLGGCDFLVCMLSLTRATRGILNAAVFAKLPKGAVVINVARGGHLIEADLLAALDNGHLAGAVLDVFETEPLPPQSPLWGHPKVTVTPHISGISQPAVVLDFVRSGVAAFERGEVPDNVVDTATAY